jgi:sulfur-carrier protein adenylyltransferase/sulfurtransferase
MLSQDELKRYNRHIILQEFGLEGQEKLKAAKVLVIGSGGLGSPVLLYLAAAGVGTIGIVDDDIVGESNLQRQILFDIEDVGASKALTAERKLKNLNPFINIISYPKRLNSSNALEIIKDFDIVVDGSDNFSTRYLCNDACVILNKPLVFGSIFKFEGQVTVFNYNNGPTYRCLFPEPPLAGEVPNCSQIGVLGVLPGIIGSLQANEVIKVITGIGEVLRGKLFVIDLLKMKSQTYKFSKNPENGNINKLIDYEEFCNERPSNEISEIDVFVLQEMIEKGEEFDLLDVRNPYEVEICEIGGTNIPLDTLENNVSMISRDKKTIVYCHYGSRSLSAIQLLQKKYGFNNLLNLRGGINDWALHIDEEMATY